MEKYPQQTYTLSGENDAIQVIATQAGPVGGGNENSYFSVGSLEAKKPGDIEAEVFLFNNSEIFSCYATVHLPENGLFTFGNLADRMVKEQSGVLLRDGLLMAHSSCPDTVTTIEYQPPSRNYYESIMIRHQALGIVNTFEPVHHPFERQQQDVTVNEALMDLGQQAARVINFFQPRQKNRNYGVLEIKLVPSADQLRLANSLKELPSFDDFGGLDDVIAQLKDVADDWRQPDLLKKYGLEKPGAILLYGPGGVGKTALMKAMARYMGAKFDPISTTEIISEWVGQPAARLRSRFNAAKRSGKLTLMFLDEFDGLFKHDAGGNSGVVTNLVAELKTILNDLPVSYKNVVLAAAANDISGIDPALTRAGRFETVIPIKLPNEQARAAIFGKLLLKHQAHFSVMTEDRILSDFISQERLAALAGDTFSGADIEQVIQDILRKRMRYERQHGSELPLSGQSELEAVIAAHRKSRPNH